MFVMFLLLFCCLFQTIETQDNDKVWILIDNVNLLPCAGQSNQFTLTKNDLSVKDRDGNTVRWIEAPGEYFIEFNNIRVLKALPNLSGRLGATLQVPLVSTGPIRLDFPYQVIPQKTLLEGTRCDNESGAIKDGSDKREYCQYCDLCSTASHVDKQLSSGSLGAVYTPKIGVGPEESFSRVCKQIDATTYNLKRSIILPGKRELEREINSNYQGAVEGILQQKLKIGTGKLQIFLNLDSSSSPPVDENIWYANNGACACCVKDVFGYSRCKASLVELFLAKKSANCLKCNNNYVKTCLQGQRQRVGCFVVEYNFKITDNWKDLEEFKSKLAPIDQRGSIAQSTDHFPRSNRIASVQSRRWPSVTELCPKTRGYCDEFYTIQDPMRQRYCCSICPQLCFG